MEEHSNIVAHNSDMPNAGYRVEAEAYTPRLQQQGLRIHSGDEVLEVSRSPGAKRKVQMIQKKEEIGSHLHYTLGRLQ